MKQLLFLSILFASTIAAAQNNTASKRTDTIHSAILKEDRYVYVHVPDNAMPGKKYPVVYVLDGEVHFDEVITTLSKLSSEGVKDATDMIVLCIGNIWLRDRDYSPTHINSSPRMDEYTASTTGGGGKFISFLEKELFPHINATCPASSTRILIGHSMGGLIAMEILLKHTSMFSYYAAIDPSMWWDNSKLLKESETIFANKKFDKQSLFLAVANIPNKKMNTEQIRTDTSEIASLIRPSLVLADYINANKKNKLKYDWKYSKDHHHMTVFLPAMYDALNFFLESL